MSAWWVEGAAPVATVLLLFVLISGTAGLSGPPGPEHRVPPGPLAPRAVPAPSAVGSSSVPDALVSLPNVLQEGLEFVEEEGELAIPPVYVVAQFLLPNTTTTTAWTLSGLSQTGDRYLVWAGYDLPYTGGGCPTSGYSLGYQVAASTGTEGSPQCVTGITPVVGDEIQLSLNLACGGTVGALCLALGDPTLGLSSSQSPAQPTGTASYFQNSVVSRPDPHGYFTGVETVVAESAVTPGCLGFPGLPTVSYSVQGFLPTYGTSGPGWLGENLSEYQVFSNETEPSGTVCASSVSPGEFVPTSTLTQYFQGGSAADGSHWMSLENWTSVTRATSMGRFQTDVVPVTATVGVNRTVADAGSTVYANATVSGNVGAYTCRWLLDGAPAAGPACAVNLTLVDTGNVNVSVLATDSADDTALAWAILTVYAAPTVLVPLAIPKAIDVGQNVTFTALYSGSLRGLNFSWNVSWPPTNCSSRTAATLTCAPPTAGTAAVAVEVTDARGVSATSPVLQFTTSPDPVVSIALAPGSASQLDVGQSTAFVANVTGGAGAPPIDWGEPPGSCVTTASTMRCRLNSSGMFPVTAGTVDANGFAATSPGIVLFVHPLPVVTLSSPGPNVTLGGNLTIDVAILDGQAGYSYAWAGLPQGCAPPAGGTLGCVPTATGTFNVTVNVTDALGGNGSAALTITVAAPAGGASWAWELGLVAAAGAAAVLLLAVVLRRRRRERPPSPTPPQGYVIVSGPTVRPPDGEDRAELGELESDPPGSGG